jgi:hypothetical protein
MGEALGIDLRVAVCAAARRRGDEVAPCQLGDGTATAAAVDLMPVGAGAVADAAGATGAMLSSVAGRALGGEPVEAVAVAFAVAPDDGPRVLAHQAAAAAAFATPLLVPRPVAIAAWFLHQAPRPEGTLLAVLDVDAGSVSVALVRRGRDGLELVGEPGALPPAGDDVDLAAHLDGAVGLLLSIVAGAGLGPVDLDAVVLAGEPPWLDQLAVQAGVATGAATAVDPQPELAAALGAALLAGSPERRRFDATGLGLLGPGLVPHALPEAPGGGLGDAVGDALAESTADVGAGVGAMLLGPGADGGAGGGLGEAAGEALGGSDIHALAGPKDAPGQAMGSLAAPSGGAAAGGGLGGLLGGWAGGRRRLAAGALAAVLAVIVVGAAVAGSLGGGGNDESAVETGDTDATGRDDDHTSTGDDDDDDTSSTTAATTTSRPGTITTLADDDGDPASPPAPDPMAPTPGAGDPPSTPGTTAGPGTTAPTTTAPRDTTPPAINGLARSPLQLTVDNGSEFCEFPKTAQGSAAVSDASGIRSVTLSFSGNGHSGGGAMSLSGGTWTGTIGPFPQNQLGVGATATVAWSVTAVDNAGNKDTVSGPTLTLYGC